MSPRKIACKVKSLPSYQPTIKVDSIPFPTIWQHPEDSKVVQIIDQRVLPHEFVIEDIATVEAMAVAIKDRHVRGAGLIGASAGYSMYLATLDAAIASDFQ